MVEDITELEVKQQNFLKITAKVIPLLYENRDFTEFINLISSIDTDASNIATAFRVLNSYNLSVYKGFLVDYLSKQRYLSSVRLAALRQPPRPSLPAKGATPVLNISGGTARDSLEESYRLYAENFLTDQPNLEALESDVEKKIDEYNKEKRTAMEEPETATKSPPQYIDDFIAITSLALEKLYPEDLWKDNNYYTFNRLLQEKDPKNYKDMLIALYLLDYDIIIKPFLLKYLTTVFNVETKDINVTDEKPFLKAVTKEDLLKKYQDFAVKFLLQDFSNIKNLIENLQKELKEFTRIEEELPKLKPVVKQELTEEQQLTPEQVSFLNRVKNIFPKVYPTVNTQFYTLLSRKIREGSYEAFVAFYLLLPESESKELKTKIEKYVENVFKTVLTEVIVDSVRRQLGGKNKKGGAVDEKLKTLFEQYTDEFFRADRQNNDDITLNKLAREIDTRLEVPINTTNSPIETSSSAPQSPKPQPQLPPQSQPQLPPQPQPQLPPQPYYPPPVTTQPSAAALLTAQADLKLLLDRRAMPLTQTLPIMFSLLCLVLGIMVTIYYLITLLAMYIKQSAVSSPLNNQTIDFETIKSVSLFGGKFNYTYFLILPILAIGGVIIFVATTVIFPSNTPVPREIKGIVLIILLSAITMLLTQSLAHAQLGKNIRAVSKRLTFFNRYVCSRIYKNFSFLNLLSEPKANIVSVNQTITDALKLLTTDTPDLEMAKAFFTLTMFYHYQKIGLRNTSIFAAFDLFDPTSLLTAGCSPADYLPRYGTYIEDIGESILRPTIQPTDKSKNIPISTIEKLDQILALTSEWVTNANGYANTIYPEDAFNSFVFLTVFTLIIQTVPFIILYFTYNNPERYAVTRGIHALGEALGVKFGASKTNE